MNLQFIGELITACKFIIFAKHTNKNMFLFFSQIQLPFTDPVLKFLIILLIILLIPILSDRIRIPHILGMIIAGIIIGPYGFNLLARDSSIILSGTAGLLYNVPCRSGN